VIFKKSILILLTSSIVYAGETTLINTIETNQKDIKRLNKAVVILINKVNKLTDTNKVLVKKLKIKETEVKNQERLREELYAQKLVELRNLKAENKKAEKELKEFIKNKSKERIHDLSKEYKTKEIVSVDNNKTKEIVSVDNNKTKEIVSVDNNKTKETISVDNNKTKEIVSIDNNKTKYIIKLELTTEKKKNLSLKTISKIKDKELRDNIILRPIGKNKIIVETKNGFDYNTTRINQEKYKEFFKKSFIVKENKDRLNSKTVYVIYLGTLKNENELGFILRTIKKDDLKKGISVKKVKKRYVAITKDYKDYNKMKKDLKRYKKKFKNAYYKKELRKKENEK